jgi:hypothetical protein
MEYHFCGSTSATFTTHCTAVLVLPVRFFLGKESAVITRHFAQLQTSNIMAFI